MVNISWALPCPLEEGVAAVKFEMFVVRRRVLLVIIGVAPKLGRTGMSSTRLGPHELKMQGSILVTASVTVPTLTVEKKAFLFLTTIKLTPTTLAMVRVTRSSRSKEAPVAETTAAAPAMHTADIPIRSIENHDESTKGSADDEKQSEEEVKKKEEKKKKPSGKSRDRLHEYKKKKRREQIRAINTSGKPNADKNALKADVYKTFKTKADYEKKTMELRQLAETQKHQIDELQKLLAHKAISKAASPSPAKPKRSRKPRAGFT